MDQGMAQYRECCVLCSLSLTGGPVIAAGAAVVAAAAAPPPPLPGAAQPAAAASGELGPQGSRVFEDASSEIASIDQRLHALQDFLKKAKSSVAAS